MTAEIVELRASRRELRVGDRVRCRDGSEGIILSMVPSGVAVCLDMLSGPAQGTRMIAATASLDLAIEIPPAPEEDILRAVRLAIWNGGRGSLYDHGQMRRAQDAALALGWIEENPERRGAFLVTAQGLLAATS